MADSEIPIVCDEPSCNTTGGKLSKHEKKLAKKNYRKARNALTREALPKATPKVFTPVDVNCSSCNTTFLAKREGSTICISCRNLTTFRENIFKVAFTVEKMPESLPVYPEYMVSVTYDIKSTTHSGYCSDHYDSDITESNSTETVLLPLFKVFKKSDITFDNTITNKKLLYKYYEPIHGYICNCGDSGTTYNIVSATVIKKSDMIQLDD